MAVKITRRNQQQQPTPDLGRLFDKLPPHAIEAEAAVIGAMIIDSAIIGDVLQIVSESDFYKMAHAAIYQAIVDQWEADTGVDMVKLKQRLTDAGTLEDIGGVPYLAELAASVPSSASAPYYAGIVRDKSLIRQLIAASGETLADAYQPGHRSAADLIDAAEARMFAITVGATDTASNDQATASEAMQAAYAELERQDGAPPGISTGFYELDDKLCGLQNGDVIIVAARPSLGKTAFALDIARHVTATAGIPSLVFSMEMSRGQLANRLLCAATGVNSQAMRKRQLTADDFGRLAGMIGTLTGLPMFIDDRGGLSLLQLRARARRLVARHDVGLIIVDYIQLMNCPGNENRQTEVSALSRGMKSLAKELNVPIVCLSQLNRGLETRENHRPRLSDLRESGSLEQDADVVLMLHREDAYHRSEPDYSPDGIAEVIIAKQRNGPIGVVKLLFDEAATTFRNLAMGSQGEF